MGNKTMVLKLLIDPKANRVLFAEAGKQVVDFLFGLLALPLGSIVKVLGKDQMVGSIGCIYSSLENLDSTYIQPDQDKNILLNPQLQQQKQCLNNLLLPSPAPAKLKAFYGCHNIRSKIQCRNYVSEVCGIDCPSCSGTMERVFKCLHPEPEMKTGNGGGENGYVKDVVSYTIMDDLSVMPISSISSITLFNKFNVKNTDALEEKIVILGKQEVVFQLIECFIIFLKHYFSCIFYFQSVELLKVSLESKTILTNVFLTNKE